MSRDPNRIDVDDYYDLTIQERQALDDWLILLGGHPTLTRLLMLDRKLQELTVEEWSFDSDGKMVYDRHTHDVLVNTTTFPYSIDPPLWKTDSLSWRANQKRKLSNGIDTRPKQ